MASTYVFLHGSPGRASIWQSLLAAAPAGTSTLALDLLELSLIHI